MPHFVGLELFIQNPLQLLLDLIRLGVHMRILLHSPLSRIYSLTLPFIDFDWYNSNKICKIIFQSHCLFSIGLSANFTKGIESTRGNVVCLSVICHLSYIFII